MPASTRSADIELLKARDAQQEVNGAVLATKVEAIDKSITTRFEAHEKADEARDKVTQAKLDNIQGWMQKLIMILIALTVGGRAAPKLVEMLTASAAPHVVQTTDTDIAGD